MEGKNPMNSNDRRRKRRAGRVADPVEQEIDDLFTVAERLTDPAMMFPGDGQSIPPQVRAAIAHEAAARLRLEAKLWRAILVINFALVSLGISVIALGVTRLWMK